MADLNQNLTAKEKVIHHLGLSHVIDQLVEELAELQQALMKMKRAMPYSRNPTPVSFEEAEAKAAEELGDVLMCVDLMGWMNIDTSDNPKWERWAERISKLDPVEEEANEEA